MKALKALPLILSASLLVLAACSSDDDYATTYQACLANASQPGCAPYAEDRTAIGSHENAIVEETTIREPVVETVDVPGTAR